MDVADREISFHNCVSPSAFCFICSILFSPTSQFCHFLTEFWLVCNTGPFVWLLTKSEKFWA
jgi:hypothetical protein